MDLFQKRTILLTATIGNDLMDALGGLFGLKQKVIYEFKTIIEALKLHACTSKIEYTVLPSQ